MNLVQATEPKSLCDICFAPAVVCDLDAGRNGRVEPGFFCEAHRPSYAEAETRRKLAAFDELISALDNTLTLFYYPGPHDRATCEHCRRPREQHQAMCPVGVAEGILARAKGGQP